MRRLISYIALGAALLVGTGVAMTPTVINMNTDAAYRDGKTFTFRISQNLELSSETVEYDPADARLKLDDTDTESIEYVSKEFRRRLDTWGLSSYEIDTLGNDTIKVTLRANNNDTTEYGYVQSYLTFSGENFELDASDTDKEEYASYDSLSSCLDYENARIEYIEQSGVSSFPVVVIPLEDPTGQYSTETIKTDFLNLIKYCDANTTEADEASGTEGHTCTLVVWANRKANDEFKNASSDVNVASRILTAQATGNDNAVWYDDADEDKETPFLQLIPASDALKDGSYHPEYAGNAYSAARYLLNCFQAPKYENNDKSLLITYLYAENATASVEDLFAYDWNQSIAFKSTLIASMIAVVLVALVLVVFEKLFALQIFSITALTVYSTLLAFVGFGAQFNIAAIFGLMVVGFVSILQGVTYANRVKDELYKGRTTKKAHQEGVKKATVFAVDTSIVTIIAGVFLFFLAGDIVAKTGTMLVIGGFFSLVFQALLNRIMGWMISTDSEAQVKFTKWFNLDKAKIPDPLKEEKQTYFGAYENKNFAKGKKWSLIVTALFVLAGIGTMIGFGAANNGNIFNDNAYTTSQTVLTIEAKSKSTSQNDNVIDNVTDLIEYDADDNVVTSTDNVLNSISLADGSKLSNHVVSVSEADTTKSIYSSEDEITYVYYYYNIVLDKEYSLDDATFAVGTDTSLDLLSAFKNALDDYGANLDDTLASVKVLTPETGVPYVGKVYLGIGIGLAVSLVYMVIRYGFGKGLTATILAAAASYASTSLFVITRISTTSIVTIGAVAAALLVLLFAIATFNKSNEMVKESREKDKDTAAFKLAQLEGATNRVAPDMIILALIAAYALVSYFAFGPRIYSSVYLNAIFGLALAIALGLTAIAPTSKWAASLFSKINIKLPKRKKKKLGQLSSNKNSSEPEEAIFIGIND